MNTLTEYYIKQASISQAARYLWEGTKFIPKTIGYGSTSQAIKSTLKGAGSALSAKEVAGLVGTGALGMGAGGYMLGKKKQI